MKTEKTMNTTVTTAAAAAVGTEISLQKWLTDVSSTCEEMITDLGIEIGEIESYTINKRYTRRLGNCRRIKDLGGDYFRISISTTAFKNENLLYATVLHEILHTCENCFCHTGRWKQLAQKVTKAYGYDITRTVNLQEYGVKIERKPKYIIGCPKCGMTFDFYKRCKYVDNPSRFCCTKCRTSLVRFK